MKIRNQFSNSLIIQITVLAQQIRYNATTPLEHVNSPLNKGRRYGKKRTYLEFKKLSTSNGMEIR